MTLAAERRPKVAIYGTGQYGLEATRIIAGYGWPIVAAYNRSGEKIGQDLGSLAGLAPMGVLVENCDEADYTNSAADIAIHAVTDRLETNMPAYRRLLGAGINVICHGGESYFPIGVNRVLAQEIDTIARANGVSFTGTGIWDYSRIWPGLLAAGSASMIERIVHKTLTNAQSAGVTLMKVCGVSMTQSEFSAANMSLIGGLYKTVPHHVLPAMGLDVTNIVEQITPILSDTPVYCDLLDQMLDPGTCLGTRILTEVYTSQGITAMSVNELRILADDETEFMMWEIEGRPSTKIRVDRSEPVHSSAACMVNRIPDVIKASPGIRLISELGPLRAQNSHRQKEGLR
jgi:4-hydroxy-tetrahydrodipicolinate reductase